MTKPVVATETITAETTTLKVQKDAYDPAVLEEVLKRTVNNKDVVKVSNGEVTVDNADIDAVKQMLATVGLEVLSDTVSAEADPNAAPADTGQSGDAEKVGNEKPVVDDKSEPKDDSTMTAKTDVKAEDQTDNAGTKPADLDPGTAAPNAAPADTGQSGDAEKVGNEKPAVDDMTKKAETVMGTADTCQMILTKLAGGADAAWTILADGNPVAKILLSAQEDSASLAAFFVTNEYRDSVQASFEKNGVAETLKIVKAHVFAEEAQAPAEMPNTDEIAKTTVASYNRCLGMALQAAQKNVIDNPLKGALFTALSARNVKDSIAVVEEVFASMPEFMATVLARTESYMGKSADALKATEDMLNEMGNQPVEDKQDEAAPAAAAYAAKLAAGSIPLTTPVKPAISAAKTDGSNIRALFRTGVTRRVG